MLRFDSDTVMLTDNEQLIRIAEKNYNTFKVSTNLVESRKTQRFYTAEHKADLDIRTSVNLIGDIINLSQELQTHMWHLINNGASYEDIKDIFYDACQLNVMSSIEIDKAKKEFAIDNAAELKKIKQKWLRKTDDGKTVKPFFFRYLANTKGYLNEETKAYRKHDTTMDYLMQIVDKYKAPSLPKDFIPLMDVITMDGYDTVKTNWAQLIDIIEAIRLYREEVMTLWNLPDNPEVNKMDIQAGYMRTLVNTINGMKLNTHTMYALLKTLDNAKYSSIRSYAFNILFNMKNGAALQLVRQSRTPVPLLAEAPNGEYQIYDFKFTKKIQTDNDKNNDD